MSTINDIRARFEGVLIREAKWHSEMFKQYNLFKQGGRWVAPKRTEIIRAEFDSSDPVEDIRKFLAISGLQEDDYNIESGQFSGKFDSWGITLNVNHDWFGKTLKKGETYAIINAVDTSSGVKQVIGDKDLTPDRLNVTKNMVGNFLSAENLMEYVSRQLESAIQDENYIDFCKDLMKAIYDYKPSSTYDDVYDMGSETQKFDIRYDLSRYVDVIDPKSIKVIDKDFGEILGGLLMFDLINKQGITTGLSFPAESNAPLTDFVFNGLEVSSKAGKGAKPSASGYIKQINDYINKTGYILDQDEKEVMDKILNPLGSKIRERPNQKYLVRSSYSTTFTNSVNLFNLHLDDNSAWAHFLKYSGLLATDINRDDIIQTFINLKMRGELHAFISKFVKLADLKKSRGRLGKLINNLLFSKNEDDAALALDFILSRGEFDIVIGIILYGCSKELEKDVNSKYGKTLSGLINKATRVKQLYMNTNIKKNQISFTLKSMDISDFKLGTLNGIDSWKLKSITISMI